MQINIWLYNLCWIVLNKCDLFIYLCICCICWMLRLPFGCGFSSYSSGDAAAGSRSAGPDEGGGSHGAVSLTDCLMFQSIKAIMSLYLNWSLKWPKIVFTHYCCIHGIPLDWVPTGVGILGVCFRTNSGCVTTAVIVCYPGESISGRNLHLTDDLVHKRQPM